VRVLRRWLVKTVYHWRVGAQPRSDRGIPSLLEAWHWEAGSDWRVRPAPSLMDEWLYSLTPGFIAGRRLASLRRIAGQSRTL
jgi:hypothetical protein